jgi:hypothetical protein
MAEAFGAGTWWHLWRSVDITMLFVRLVLTMHDAVALVIDGNALWVGERSAVIATLEFKAGAFLAWVGGGRKKRGKGLVHHHHHRKPMHPKL